MRTYFQVKSWKEPIDVEKQGVSEKGNKRKILTLAHALALKIM